MIIIDGRESELSLSNYANLEEALVNVVKEEGLGSRVITDVLVDDEPFSELYPHQAEDIEAGTFTRLELRTVSLDTMATDVAGELPKVIRIMADGSIRAAELFRKSELSEGLEVLQDIVGVSRDLVSTLDVLRAQYSTGSNNPLDELAKSLSELLGEIGDVMESEDWLLVADLMQYEFAPACEGWRKIIDDISKDVDASKSA